MDFCHFGEFGLDARVFIFAPVAGLGWLLAYIDLIRLGFKQKTYGMPIAALALNIVWEGLYAYMYWAHDGMFYGGYMMALVNTAWFIADCLILYTHIKRFKISKKSTIVGSFRTFDYIHFFNLF